MKLSKLIKQLERDLENKGDMEVIMQATLLPNGYSMSKHGIEDVFNSTIENTKEVEFKDTKALQIFWQM